MKIKKLTIYLLIAVMAFGTVSCKKSDTKSENGQEQLADKTDLASNSEKEEEDKGAANGQVTEENFRSFPVTDESMFNVDDAEGGVKLSRCKSELKDKVIVVPEKIDGAEVVAIETGAFIDNEDVVAIVLPDTVKMIEDTAFNGCTKLKYVYFGSGLKETGDMMFYFCKKLEKIDLPEGTERINGVIAFSCSSLKEIIVPASATDIPNGIMLSEDFDGVIKTPAGSAAEKAALEEGLKVENY